jgi:hypothetical protein
MSRKAKFNWFRDQLDSFSTEELTQLSDEIEFELWERASLEDYHKFYGEDQFDLNEDSDTE